MIAESSASIIRGHWEESWGTLLSGLKKILDNDPGIDLGHALSILDKWTERDDTFLELNKKITARNSLPTDESGLPMLSLAAYQGRYKTIPRTVKHSHFVSNIISDYITDDTEVLVELGSGWGENLFRIYMRLINENRHINLKYIACELTQSGREATDLLSKTAPEMDCKTHYFNYFKPDLSFIDNWSNALFFSSHSVEQIKSLPEEIFAEIINNSAKCQCVHIEPIGWQRFEELVTGDLSSIAGNVDPKEYIPLDPFFTRNAAILARTRDYNQNLLSLLESLQEAGDIEIREKNFDVFGANPFNPSTVIAWEKSKQST